MKNYSFYRKEINKLWNDIQKNLPNRFSAEMFIDILRKIAPLLYAEAMKGISERVFRRWIAWYYIPQELVRKGFVTKSALISIQQNNKRDNAFSKLWHCR